MFLNSLAFYRQETSMQNKVKIIGGKWRATNLEVVDAKGVRPTNIRLRETLFNWLMPYLENAKCLDLFAGSGALGLEALSRGAASCVFVDILPKNIANLALIKSKLKAENIYLYKQDFIKFLEENSQTFDIIFLDPPFETKILAKSLEKLAEQDFLQAKFIYLEFEATKRHSVFVPKGFRLLKKTLVGETQTILLQKHH